METEPRTNASFATLADLAAGFAARGSHPAVIAFGRDGARTLSYAELGSAVERAAAFLHARGVAPGDRVALWAPNSVEWIAAYFAIARLGAAGVPLDHQTPAAGLRAALEHSAPRLVLTTSTRCTELTAALPRLECVALDAPLPGGPAAAPVPAATVDARALASLLFTSGTTGTPKAVPLTHANLTANTRALLAARLIGARDRVLVPLPLHHTYPFTVGLLTALATGATLVLPAGISGPEIVRAATDAGVTALLAVPRLCTALYDSVVAGARARGPVAFAAFRVLLGASIALRRVTGLNVGKRLFAAVHARIGAKLDLIGCGGAKLPPELAAKLQGLGWTVLTGYGLTETSPVLTFNSRARMREGSEGCALPGTEVRIADVDAETPGEILARGPSVFAGYWRNPAATQAAFTADGWFRTGDLGRIDAHGFLYVVGRSKELIVLADGKKLFPDTVEETYAAACPLVKEIGIFERDGALAALIVPDEDAVKARGALREATLLREELEDIAARLPPYQRIGLYRVTREPLPRTQLGKLRRHLLPGLFEAAATGQPPTQSAEASHDDLALLESARGSAVWSWLRERYPTRALTLDTSPQFDLAIDSLEWVTLTAEIERRFGVELDPETLSGIVTLRDLVRAIAAATPAAPRAARPAVAFERPGPAARALGACLLFALRTGVRLLWRVRTANARSLPEGAVLFTPNHTSYLDPVVLIAALPWSRLRRTYWAGWVGVMFSSAPRRLVSRLTQVFPVDPDRDLGAAVATARELLARGYSVVWFPEGRRSPTGELTAFQAGVGLVLHGTAAAAVPTAIRGTFAAWPKQHRTPRLGRVDVTFGAPLAFPAQTPTTAIASRLEDSLRQLLGAASPRAPRPGVTTHERRGPTMADTAIAPVNLTLRDGRQATIRPVRRADIDSIARFIDGLSPMSKHLLFLGGVARLSDAALTRLCDPDFSHDMAFVATTADASARLLGFARYAGSGDGAGAEIAVAVADDWQHQGLGTALLRRLIGYAREHGVAQLYSLDAVTNEPMRRLAHELGAVEQPDPEDIHQVIYSLHP